MVYLLHLRPFSAPLLISAFAAGVRCLLVNMLSPLLYTYQNTILESYPGGQPNPFGLATHFSISLVCVDSDKVHVPA